MLTRGAEVRGDRFTATIRVGMTGARP